MKPRHTQSCTRYGCKPDKPCGRCSREIAVAMAAEDVAWFERTGHCGACGQPGEVCTCTENAPCGCRDLHPMGSGRDADPTVVFAVPVTDDQPELF